MWEEKRQLYFSPYSEWPQRIHCSSVLIITDLTCFILCVQTFQPLKVYLKVNFILMQISSLTSLYSSTLVKYTELCIRITGSGLKEGKKKKKNQWVKVMVQWIIEPNYSMLVPVGMCIASLFYLEKSTVILNTNPIIGNNSQTSVLWVHYSKMLFPWFCIIHSNNASTYVLH